MQFVRILQSMGVSEARNITSPLNTAKFEIRRRQISRRPPFAKYHPKSSISQYRVQKSAVRSALPRSRKFQNPEKFYQRGAARRYPIHTIPK